MHIWVFPIIESLCDIFQYQNAVVAAELISQTFRNVTGTSFISSNLHILISFISLAYSFSCQPVLPWDVQLPAWTKSTTITVFSGFVLAQSLQSCRTLCDPMDCSLPGSSVLGDSPDKNTEVAMPFSRWSSRPRVEPTSPALQADSLLTEPPGKHNKTYLLLNHLEPAFCPSGIWNINTALRSSLS